MLQATVEDQSPKKIHNQIYSHVHLYFVTSVYSKISAEENRICLVLIIPTAHIFAPSTFCVSMGKEKDIFTHPFD